LPWDCMWRAVSCGKPGNFDCVAGREFELRRLEGMYCRGESEPMHCYHTRRWHLEYHGNFYFAVNHTASQIAASEYNLRAKVPEILPENVAGSDSTRRLAIYRASACVSPACLSSHGPVEKLWGYRRVHEPFRGRRWRLRRLFSFAFLACRTCSHLRTSSDNQWHV
jgi:hypothetical protein